MLEFASIDICWQQDSWKQLPDAQFRFASVSKQTLTCNPLGEALLPQSSGAEFSSSFPQGLLCSRSSADFVLRLGLPNSQ